MPTAYSYIRFSSEKQKTGDSESRQLLKAQAYAVKHGLTLDTHSYRDLGVPAFKGQNFASGKLGTFVAAVAVFIGTPVMMALSKLLFAKLGM